MSLVADKTGMVIDQALNLRFKRQQLLVANIANVDTPNYQPVDLAFEAALKAAVVADDTADMGATGFRRTDAMHLSSHIDVHSKSAEVLVRTDVTNSLDGNGVDLDKEMARITDNSAQFQVMLEVARRRFSILTELITTMNQG